jgi:hypothetical protein
VRRSRNFPFTRVDLAGSLIQAMLSRFDNSQNVKTQKDFLQHLPTQSFFTFACQHSIPPVKELR